MLEIIKSLLIAFFAVALLLPVVRYALRRLSPALHVEAMSADEMKYMQKQELKLTIAYFFFACLLSVFSSGVLAMISSIIHASKDHLHVLTPNFRALFAPGLLLGLTLAILPLRLVQSSLLGQDYEMYKNYTARMEGRNSNRTYNVLLLLMLLISGVVIWYALRWHVTIDEERIEITNLMLEQRSYALDDIESIHYLGAEGEYLVSFEDNTNLNTTYLKPVQLEMIALLAERSGHRVIR
ncbi:hypothetical protein POKO110462_00695 [Pontibacter korlensis]|uniref:Uncharacterized protein n=1 Tax=Pontibacter korlensis TaxID=400092 RepID=A0A0E3ZEB4_9BACT|nr:hypothetical protein [Pontibacter korlensis]AKD02790.1 hypothetical protein PKOR_06205 [Pontibacter korlensis]